MPPSWRHFAPVGSEIAPVRTRGRVRPRHSAGGGRCRSTREAIRRAVRGGRSVCDAARTPAPRGPQARPMPRRPWGTGPHRMSTARLRERTGASAAAPVRRAVRLTIDGRPPNARRRTSWSVDGSHVPTWPRDRMVSNADTFHRAPRGRRSCRASSGSGVTAARPRTQTLRPVRTHTCRSPQPDEDRQLSGTRVAAAIALRVVLAHRSADGHRRRPGLGDSAGGEIRDVRPGSRGARPGRASYLGGLNRSVHHLAGRSVFNRR